MFQPSFVAGWREFGAHAPCVALRRGWWGCGGWFGGWRVQRAALATGAEHPRHRLQAPGRPTAGLTGTVAQAGCGVDCGSRLTKTARRFHSVVFGTLFRSADSDHHDDESEPMPRPAAQPADLPIAEARSDRHGHSESKEFGFKLHGPSPFESTHSSLCVELAVKSLKSEVDARKVCTRSVRLRSALWLYTQVAVDICTHARSYLN
jgi:hypothetical protein